MIKTFAAIYIGSYEVNLKIFEMSQKKKIRKIDHIRRRVELGKDAYTKGMIGYELVEELCKVLKEFHQIMDMYRVEDYRAYASAVLKNASNGIFVLEQIRLRTKLEVRILSSSENRFIGYKSLAFHPSFEQMLQERAAVVDVGGGSLQITLFLKGRAVTTQQLELGIMRMREKVSAVESQVAHYERELQELIDRELGIFKKLYLQNKDLKYVVIVGDYIGGIMRKAEPCNEYGAIKSEQVLKTLKKLQKRDVSEIAQELNLPNEHDTLLLPAVVLYKRLLEEINAEYVWLPGVDISDGIAYDYAQNNRILKPIHNFDEDVLSAAYALAERYQSDSEHTQILAESAGVIFDALKNVHGLGKRERLLLKTSSILHDCGRYISLVNQAEYAYQIIMNTELIGISNQEREIVANAVRFTGSSLPVYEKFSGKMDQESYVLVAKLAAILKLANVMDRSHKQKLKNVKAVIKDKKLIITAESVENIVLEKALFEKYSDVFESVFSIKPLLKEKRVLQQGGK